jgi:hypothetical protein
LAEEKDVNMMLASIIAENGETKYITLEDIQRDFDYTADARRALDIIKKEYADPAYSLHIIRQ